MAVKDDLTFDGILRRILGRVKNNVDKREGAVIYDSAAAVAVELKEVHIRIDEALEEVFPDTATRPFLTRHAAGRGITPDAATYAVLRGAFTPATVDVTGRRFSAPNSEMNYTVTEKLEEENGESVALYRVTAETPGSAGNRYLGAIIPVENVNGLETAALLEIITPGEDEQTTASLRVEYFAGFDSQAFGGNIADYADKIGNLPGVGGVKVYRAPSGGGTVGIVITDAENKKPSDTLIADVQTAIDPEQNQGAGLGLAPIGHTVTVAGVSEAVIAVQLHITYESGWSWAAVAPYVEKEIDAYFAELSAEWDKVDWIKDVNATLVVRISQIESRILNLAGIVDVQGTLLNGQAQNFVFAPDSIPQRGLVTDGA